MTRGRKINVSQVEGNNNGVLPAGTIVAYDNGSAGYTLRVHNGITAGGVPFNGSNGIVNRTVSFPNGDVGDTAGTLANDDGQLYFCTADYVDLNQYINTPYSLATSEIYSILQSDGTINSATILRNANAAVLFILENGGLTASDWSITMADSDFGGAQTCTDVGFNVDGNIFFHWTHGETDPNEIPQGSEFTVTYTGTLNRPAIWERVIGGNRIEYFDEVLDYTSSVELTGNFRVDVDDAHLDVDGDGFWSLGSNNYDTSIFSTDRTTPDPADIIIRANDNDWLFDSEGNLTLPTGGDILDSNGNSVLGGDANVWIQTFETVDGAPTDVPAIATSVEYDAAGNVIALFSHINTITQTSYYSVGKYTTAGAKIWTARFLDDFYTDGWGLAVDNDSSSIYVAGKTTPESGGYSVSTLTKIDSTDGSIVWSKTYDFGYSSASSVVDVAADGSPVMVGYANNAADSYITTTKISAVDGSITWTRSLDGQGYEQAYGMAVGPSGEVVAIGYMDQLGLGSTNSAATLTSLPSSNTNWITPITVNAPSGVSFDITFNAGVPTLTVTLDTVGGRTIGDEVTTVLGSALGGVDGNDDMIVLVDTVNTEIGSQDDHMLVVKYTSTGTIAWQKAILFDVGFDCRGADADIDSAGNIYVTGNYEYSFNGDTTSALSILKLDGTGAKQWSRRVVGDCDTFGVSVVVGADDKLYLSGETGTDLNSEYTWVAAKYGIDGTVEWQRLIDNTVAWSFAGGLFFSNGGGSSIAVKQDYVALAGGFGGPGLGPYATVVQIAATGDVFSVGDWDVKAALFSGLLNGTASDITVVDAGKTDTDNSANVTTSTVSPMTEVSGFLIGTLYTVSDSNDRLVNGGNELVLGTTGTITLPAGGTISEGIVTSNPTIQLTPASPDVASQKLVIKGGGQYTYIDNGITLNYYNNTAIVNDTVTVYVYSDTYADQTLYWWIYPTGANLATPSSGTVVLTGNNGDFTFTLDSDDYEFTVRVSPESDNYDPANVGVESGLINSGSPTYGAEHHLHLTTGDLSETSIFLGTDDHNVRTTTDGTIQITTPNTTNNVWEFGTDGTLTLPGAITRVVSGTVAKTGVELPTTTGAVDGLTHNSVLSGLTDATYGPFTRGAVTFSVVVFGGVINGFSNVSGTATVDDVLGTIDSGDIGGTAGTTITITVSSVVQATPTAIDLTKSINKLASGNYALADGVEGQIMYLVPQNGITIAANVAVSVANFRTVDFTGTDGPLLPFRIYNGVDTMDSTGLCTLIFTDGAWQQSGGAWD